MVRTSEKLHQSVRITMFC